MTSQDSTRIKLRVPDEIVALIRGCHPQLKGKIRAGLRHIIVEPESGKSLKDDLDGLKSYRISRFRIVYRISSKRMIDVVAIGPRRTIYEETYKIIKKEADQK
jgi:mRNA interferase RelE/StbE